jgi:hypothetical protein
MTFFERRAIFVFFEETPSYPEDQEHAEFLKIGKKV